MMSRHDLPNTTLILEASLLSDGCRLLEEPGSAWAGCDVPCKAAADPDTTGPTERAGASERQG